MTLPQHWLRDEPLVKWCPSCARMVNRWHKHWGKADFVALPTITRND